MFTVSLKSSAKYTAPQISWLISVYKVISLKMYCSGNAVYIYTTHSICCAMLQIPNYLVNNKTTKYLV